MSGAVLSPCGKHRYVLTRDLAGGKIDFGNTFKQCLFIMLNPSTADAGVDDPTVRKCMGFATRWGCSKLTVVNLLSLRITDPNALMYMPRMTSPDNERHVLEQLRAHESWLQNGDLIVAAWGCHPASTTADARAIKALVANYKTACLGTTRHGHPKHPLYRPYASNLVGFRP